MTNVVVMSHGTDPYNHEEGVEHDIYYSSFINNPVLMLEYLAFAERKMKEKNTGWYTMYEINTRTGEVTPIFNKTNPLRTRTELNIPAKQAQALSKARKIKINNPFTEQELPPSLFSVMQNNPNIWSSSATSSDPEEVQF